MTQSSIGGTSLLVVVMVKPPINYLDFFGIKIEKKIRAFMVL